MSAIRIEADEGNAVDILHSAGVSNCATRASSP